MSEVDRIRSVFGAYRPTDEVRRKRDSEQHAKREQEEEAPPENHDVVELSGNRESDDANAVPENVTVDEETASNSSGLDIET
ncbi:MAG: hypothetical protein ACOCX1_05620 [Fimbriimonadaceae bacterium]